MVSDDPTTKLAIGKTILDAANLPGPAPGPPPTPTSSPPPTPRTNSQGPFLDGVLVKLQISYWTGRRSLHSEDLGLNAEAIPDIFALGSKMIVPKNTISLFGKVRAKADYSLTQLSFPFPLSDAHFVPYTVLPKVMEALETQKVRFDAAVGDFLSHYAEYHEQLVAEYPEHKEALTRAFIPSESLKARFGFQMTFYSISVPRGMRVKAITGIRAVREAKAKQDAIAAIQQKYEIEFKRQMDDFLGQSVVMLRQRVTGVVKSVAVQMEKGDLNNRSLKSLRQVIQSFRDLNFMSDNAVETALNNLERSMPVGVGELSDESVSMQFVKALNVVEQVAKGNKVARVVERYGRKMILE